ncbi:uncharacterized protein [Euwallacea similis]|uniref:uncharacterized protein n=1 Tax=Euwallacea similis TaxID=1736056 RepID=UPI00344C9A95
MTSLKIVAVAALVLISSANSSILPAPVLPAPVLPALPAFRYTQVAPPSVLPFSAQVSTFSRNLHVFDAPYAAGVLPGPPAIVQRALLPAPAAPLIPAPIFARAAPVLPTPWIRSVHAVAPVAVPPALLPPAWAPGALLG